MPIITLIQFLRGHCLSALNQTWIRLMHFIDTKVCHVEEMKMTSEWQEKVPQRQQFKKKTLLQHGEIRALNAKVAYHSPHSFWLAVFLGPFRCSIRTNSIASEAAQSIRQTVDSAGRASISHGVTQRTPGDLRSPTVLADALPACRWHYFWMLITRSTERRTHSHIYPLTNI